MNSDFPPKDITQYRDYAWKYFHGHAVQRLQSFNFYLALATVLSGAIVKYLLEGRIRLVLVAFCLILLGITWLFWGMEKRNEFLVHLGIEALKKIEKSEEGLLDDGCIPHPLKLLTHEKYQMDQQRLGSFYGRLTMPSYTNCFTFIFGSFFILGSFSMLYILWMKYNLMFWAWVRRHLGA